MRRLIALLLLVCVVPAHALRAAPRAKHRKKAHHPSWFEYRALPPTPESLYQQNEVIDKLGLPRIQDSKALEALVQSGDLVPITKQQVRARQPEAGSQPPLLQAVGGCLLARIGAGVFRRIRGADTGQLCRPNNQDADEAACGGITTRPQFTERKQAHISQALRWICNVVD